MTNEKADAHKIRSRMVVGYTLRDTTHPIGVSAYQITQALSEKLRGSLPTIEQWEAEFAETGEEDRP